MDKLRNEEQIRNNDDERCKKSSRTEFDAIHPRFRTEDPEQVKEFQITNDYYCEQCQLYFAPDVDGLKTHFKEDMVHHRPVGSCFYCQGPVYAYSFNTRTQIHHSCKDTNKKKL
ncbi:hypothetical protein RN001_013651 [Aquatica leii]|uniref:Uncharacterized protein n=1 Tax=Aquatica leii TaxID=1421715 RepID=A0AAN7S754_9COLE|nr:hypothetical protein RN001_013651 [Aquatica leii]